MKIFICWSGERSRVVAEALRDWLKRVIQQLDPFYSTEDIRIGARWILEITTQLAQTQFGILCLTKENLDAPWLNFEAGALSKTVDNRTFVCPYLIGGLQSAEVPNPLGQFQSNSADKAGTLKLLKTINSALGEKKLEESVLNDTFGKYWEDLEKVLKNLPVARNAERPKRKLEDMTQEILDTVRSLAFMMQNREEIVPSFFPESTESKKLPITWLYALKYLSENKPQPSPDLLEQLKEEHEKWKTKKEESKKKEGETD